MQFGSSACGSVGFGSVEQDPGASDAEASRPITTELNGVDIRGVVKMDTVRITDTLGQPVTCSFTMRDLEPQVGDNIRIRYFAFILFAGTIDHVNKTSPDLRTFEYGVDCLDWSQTLLRRKLRRNFTNLPIVNIIDSIVDNELAGEGLTIGTIETGSILPLVDSKGGKVFDAMRQMAGATGQTFYVDFDKTIQMRSASAPIAPLILNEANTLLDATSVVTDRETYRNRQIVVVTGTVAAGQSGAANVTSISRDNADQIAARQLIEGGTGIYEEIEEVTHPTSNDAGQLALLGIGYANLRLAVSGQTRLTFKCQVRGYGFRAGQIATVDLPTFGIAGTYIVQRVTLRERIGSMLFHDLELTNSSLQQRAYEAWLSIVKAGKVTVQVPSATTNNLQSFITPGVTTWTVPAGVTTVEFTVLGGSGGGGGGRWGFSSISGYFWVGNGGRGGHSGKAITIVTPVVPGQVFDVTTGSAGVAGANGVQGDIHGVGSTAGTNGTDGTLSVVSLSGVVKCQGNGGLKGLANPPGGAGANGNGVGDAVTIGGGKTGGAGGTVSAAPKSGSDGSVEVRW